MQYNSVLSVLLSMFWKPQETMSKSDPSITQLLQMRRCWYAICSVVCYTKYSSRRLARWMKLKMFGQFITFVKTLRTNTSGEQLK